VRGNAGRPQVTSVAFRGKVVIKRYISKCPVALKEVRRFLQDSDSQLRQHVLDKNGLLFCFVYHPNTSLLKVQMHLFFGFIKMMTLWRNLCESDSIKMFVIISISKNIIMKSKKSTLTIGHRRFTTSWHNISMGKKKLFQQ
jgi:hypothetical protein